MLSCWLTVHIRVTAAGTDSSYFPEQLDRGHRDSSPTETDPLFETKLDSGPSLVVNTTDRIYRHHINTVCIRCFILKVFTGSVSMWFPFHQGSGFHSVACVVIILYSRASSPPSGHFLIPVHVLLPIFYFPLIRIDFQHYTYLLCLLLLLFIKISKSDCGWTCSKDEYETRVLNSEFISCYLHNKK